MSAMARLKPSAA